MTAAGILHSLTVTPTENSNIGHFTNAGVQRGSEHKWVGFSKSMSPGDNIFCITLTLRLVTNTNL